MRAALKSQNGDDVMSSSPEEPAHRGSYMGVSSSPDGPTENARQRNTRKIWQHLEHFQTSMASTRRSEEEAPTKARAGANRIRVQRKIIRMRAIVTADNCSRAVASRRAKYNGDFRVLLE